MPARVRCIIQCSAGHVVPSRVAKLCSHCAGRQHIRIQRMHTPTSWYDAWCGVGDVCVGGDVSVCWWGSGLCGWVVGGGKEVGWVAHDVLDSVSHAAKFVTHT